MPVPVAVEALTCTPGFSGWQQEHWLAHCEDAGVFLGRVGRSQLAELPLEATEALRAELRSTHAWPADEIDRYIGSLDRDGTPTGYLFRCTPCGT